MSSCCEVAGFWWFHVVFQIVGWILALAPAHLFLWMLPYGSSFTGSGLLAYCCTFPVMALPSDGCPGAPVMSLLVPRSDLCAGWVAHKQSAYLACCRQAIETKELPPLGCPWDLAPAPRRGKGGRKGEGSGCKLGGIGRERQYAGSIGPAGSPGSIGRMRNWSWPFLQI